MRALLLDRPGGPESLRLGEAPKPAPGPAELRIQVAACGLNPLDIELMQAGHPSWRWPHIPGLDVAGSVDAVGAEVRGFEVGERVLAHLDPARPGGLAEYVVADAQTVSRLPVAIDWVTAASLPCAAFTAWHCITRRLNLAEGQTLLVQAGAGGVGGFAIQMARHRGARVLATCSSVNLEHVSRLGAEPIDYSRESVPERVLAMPRGRGVDAIVEAFGGAQAAADLGLLAHNGSMACLRGLPPLDKLPPRTLAPSLHEVFLGGAHLNGNRHARADLVRLGDEVLALLAGGAIRPLPIRAVAHVDAPAALAALATGHGRGKWVVRIT